MSIKAPNQRMKTITGKSSISSVSIVSREDRKLLRKTCSLIEELLETLDVLNSPEEKRKIAQAKREIKRGKGRPLNELVEANDA